MCSCLIPESSCDHGPSIILHHFKTVSNCNKNCLSNVLLTFQPVDASSIFILSMFQNLCWHMKKEPPPPPHTHKVEF